MPLWLLEDEQCLPLNLPQPQIKNEYDRFQVEPNHWGRPSERSLHIQALRKGVCQEKKIRYLILHVPTSEFNPAIKKKWIQSTPTRIRGNPKEVGLKTYKFIRFDSHFFLMIRSRFGTHISEILIYSISMRTTTEKLGLGRQLQHQFC